MDDDATDSPVSERVGDRLRERDETLAVAESCTGGLVGSKITDVPGSSDYFDRSLVTYSYAAKQELLAVSREALDAHGAVSEAVAAEMAQGVRDTAGTDWGVATTGVAGPGGGTDATPVGTVYIAVAEAAPWETNESGVTVSHYEFDGDRREIKDRIATQALSDLETAIRE
ncbi:CinA family protein [Haloarcula salina]|uniref:CinA family protein n=1 Tax=Haloarcula salina TaxID=1429914 RepID=UPI003C6FBF1F